MIIMCSCVEFVLGFFLGAGRKQSPSCSQSNNDAPLGEPCQTRAQALL